MQGGTGGGGGLQYAMVCTVLPRPISSAKMEELGSVSTEFMVMEELRSMSTEYLVKISTEYLVRISTEFWWDEESWGRMDTERMVRILLPRSTW